jgi:hypothetical protein
MVLQEKITMVVQQDICEAVRKKRTKTIDNFVTVWRPVKQLV